MSTGEDVTHEMPVRSWFFLFSGYRLLVEVTENAARVPLCDPGELRLGVTRPRPIGSIEGHSCVSGELPAYCVVPTGMAVRGLRSLHPLLPEPFFRMALRAVQILEWDRTSLYCGRCGERTREREGELVKECPGCGISWFPRTSPAVIVLVEREGKALLAHARRFTEGLYSVLAGFVEPGETLEEAVAREIQEEVGIHVTDIRYFGSQPWPFPDSFMVGFTARYESGEIRADGTEITHADWFSPNELPTIPDPVSIARRLIDWFVDRHRQQ